jgi:hypothetical protein
MADKLSMCIQGFGDLSIGHGYRIDEGLWRKKNGREHGIPGRGFIDVGQVQGQSAWFSAA